MTSMCVRSLTKREFEVLNLVKLGLSNKEIALKLGISTETIKVYMNKIFIKLNVKNRTQATVWYVNNSAFYCEKLNFTLIKQ